MEYYPYIIFINHILSLFFSVFTLKYSINVLFKKVVLKTSTNHSPIFTVYFIIIFITGAVNCLNGIYLVSFWRPNIVIYKPQLLYIFGVISTIFIFINSAMEAFLCLDRIFTVFFNLRYTPKFKIFMTFITVISMAVLIIFYTFINEFIQRMPIFSTTNCTSFGCLINLYPPLYVVSSKIISTFINIIFCFILFLLFKIYLKSTNAGSKRISKTVILIITITSVVDFGPILIGKIIWMVYGIDLATYIGPYVQTLSFLNITICAGIYSDAFKKTAMTLNSQQIQLSIIRISNSKIY